MFEYGFTKGGGTPGVCLFSAVPIGLSGWGGCDLGYLPF